MLKPSPRKRKSSDAKACRHQRLCCERLDPGDSECDNIFRLLAPEIVRHILTFATLRSVVSLACATKSVHGVTFDTKLWRALIQQEFPSVVIYADGYDDLRTIYRACMLGAGTRFVHYDRVGTLALPPSPSSELWRRPVFARLPDPRPEPARYIADLRRAFLNGGVVFARFSVSLDVRLDWFVTRDKLGEIDFLQHFLGSDAVRDVLVDGWVQYEHKPDLLETGTMWRIQEWNLLGSRAALTERLADVLHFGGAYSPIRPGEHGNIDEATRALVGPESAGTRCRAWYTHELWCDWFHGVAWDRTFVGLNANSRQVWLLCATDTD